jgi:hypothetical protein
MLHSTQISDVSTEDTDHETSRMGCVLQGVGHRMKALGMIAFQNLNVGRNMKLWSSLVGL